MLINLVPSQTCFYLFPLALSTYLLLRMEKRLENVAKVLNLLIEKVDKQHL